MKKLIFISFALLLYSNINSQVGVNTENPQATLHVVGNPTDSSKLDGIIPPKLTGDELSAKSYTSNQIGAVVYVSSIPSTITGQVSYINDIGYYLFDGNYWQALGQEFVKIKNGSSIGFSTKYRRNNPTYYGAIGNRAVDFSYNDFAATTKGAIGANSFAIGENTSAIGSGSFVGGYNSKADGTYAMSFGFGNESSGTTSFTVGQSNRAKGINDVLMGFNNSSIPSSSNNIILGNSNQNNSSSSAYILGQNNIANMGSFLIGNNLNSNSYLTEIIIGSYNEAIPTGLGFSNSPILTLASGGNDLTRKNALVFYRNNSFKLTPIANLSTLSNLTLGLHALDSQGNLNTYNGTAWKKYIAVHFSTSEPTSASAGDLYYNTVSNKYFAFDGTTWNPLW